MVFKFDLSSIPKNSKIVSAKLQLYSLLYEEKDTIQDDPSNPKWDKGPIGVIKHPGNNFKYLYPVYNDWVETGATWDIANSCDVYDFNMYTTIYAGNPKIYPNAPDSFPENSISFGGSRERETWEEYDITKYVQEVTTGDIKNHGYFMSTQRTDSVITYMFSAKYASSEYADKSLRPKLTVVYDGTVNNNTWQTNESDMTFSNNVLNLKSNFAGSDLTHSVFNLKGQKLFTKTYRLFTNKIDLKPVLKDLKGKFIIQIDTRENGLFTIPVLITD